MSVFTTFSRMRRRFRVISPAVFGSLPSRPEDLARWMEVMRREDRHHSPLGYGAWPRHLIHSIINHEYTAMRSCCPTVAGPSGIPRNEETTASTPEPGQILECWNPRGAHLYDIFPAGGGVVLEGAPRVLGYSWDSMGSSRPYCGREEHGRD